MICCFQIVNKTVTPRADGTQTPFLPKQDSLAISLYQDGKIALTSALHIQELTEKSANIGSTVLSVVFLLPFRIYATSRSATAIAPPLGSKQMHLHLGAAQQELVLHLVAATVEQVQKYYHTFNFS